jgi:hypothetical protein
MTKQFALGSMLLMLGTAIPARAHITPPVVLASDRDAVAGLLGGSSKYLVREVRLSPAQKQEVQRRTGWSPEDDFHRFYVGRDDQGRMVGAAAFLSEFTIHGPVRVAVALGEDGKVKGATVVEVTEESYTWVKPLLDQGYTRSFVGLDARQRFDPPAVPGGSMSRFYARVIAGLVERAAVLYDLTNTRGALPAR